MGACVVGRKVVDHLGAAGLQCGGDAVYRSVTGQQADLFLDVLSIGQIDRLPYQAADLAIRQQPPGQIGADVSGYAGNQNALHGAPSAGSGPYCAKNSARVGSAASLSDKMTCSTRSSGQLTDS